MSITTSAITSTGNTVYTSGGNTAITWLSITNFGNATVDTNVWVVPNGSSPGNTNLIVANLAILSAANTTGGEKLLLSNGDSIYATATANTLNAVVSYTSI